jgi:hypothetical protein
MINDQAPEIEEACKSFQFETDYIGRMNGLSKESLETLANLYQKNNSISSCIACFVKVCILYSCYL